MADIVYPGEQVSSASLNSAALPKNYDLVIYKGDYVELLVTVKDTAGAPIDIAGSTPAASLKDNFDDGTPIDFTCTLTGTLGQVRIYLPSATSSTLVAGDYIWDFQLTNAQGQTRTYLAGDVKVWNEVTI